jgi:hypothetical protein
MSQDLMPYLAAPVERTIAGTAAHDAEGVTQSIGRWYSYETFAGDDE